MAKFNSFGEREEKVAALKRKYPSGTRIKFYRMFGKTAAEPERYGTILFIDNLGTVVIKADNGERVRIIPDIDHFVRLNEND